MGSCKAADQEYKARGLQPATALPESCGRLRSSLSLNWSAVPTGFHSFLGGLGAHGALEEGASVKAVGGRESARRGAAGCILNVCLSPPFAETPTLTAAIITPSCSSPRC